MVDDSVDMKTRIEKVLEDYGFSETRAAKMNVNDLLKCVNPFYLAQIDYWRSLSRLLAAFHDIGVHFA